MFAACGSGDVKTIRCLLEAGVDVNARDANDLTPLFYAIFTNQHLAIGVLIDAGASPHEMLKRYPSWPHEFISKKPILGPESIAAISQAKGWDWDVSRNDDGRTVLASIVSESNSVRFSQAQALIAAGANAEAEDAVGLTPLALASFSGSPEMVRLLAENSAIDRKMQFSEGPGWTALHVAATGAVSGRLSRVSMLLELGANPHILDDKQRSARTCAEESGFADVVALLDSHEALASIKRIATSRPAP